MVTADILEMPTSTALLTMVINKPDIVPLQLVHPIPRNSMDKMCGIITRIAIASNRGCQPASQIATKRQPFRNFPSVNADICITTNLYVGFHRVMYVFQFSTIVLFPWQRQPF